MFSLFKRTTPAPCADTPETRAIEARLEELREEGRNDPESWRHNYVLRENLAEQLRHARYGKPAAPPPAFYGRTAQA